MTLPVYVCSSVAGLDAGSVVTVDGEEARHAVVVKRTRVGERVALTDGAGTMLTGVVVSADKQSMSVRAESVLVEERPEPRVVVVQAIPKGDRGELAVEVLTEVGADVIVPWAASRSVAVWRGDRAAKSLARWRSTAREAAKQSRRAWFPQVAEPASIDDVVALLAGAALSVVLHEEGSRALAGLTLPEAGEVVVVVGPEGGISDEELSAFSTAGAEPVRLGPSVLRTSTAGVAAVAALLSRTPRWR